MIHFSLTPEDAKFVMKALSLWATVDRRVTGIRGKQAQLKRVASVVRAARKAPVHAGNDNSTRGIEEIHTKEGVELCPKIS